MQRKSVASSLFTAIAGLAALFVMPVHAANPECAAFIQGRIAWDYQGSTAWNPQNVDRLCQGTSQPSQPPACFNHVVHGNIQWGNGANWQWNNAIDLCAGTNNAAATIDCFQAKLRSGSQWPAAIAACKAPAPSGPQSVTLALENRTHAPVQVYWINAQGNLQSYGILAAGERKDQQTYVGHAWEFMQDGKSIGRITAGNTAVQAYVVGAVDSGDTPIWSTDDAQKKCPATCSRTGRTWTGDWTTVVQGERSVCRCVAVARAN